MSSPNITTSAERSFQSAIRPITVSSSPIADAPPTVPATLSSPVVAPRISSLEQRSNVAEATTTTTGSPSLPPRAPPRALHSHIALAASQVIFAASMTIVRSAFIDSNEVSPIVIIAARLLLSLAAFAVIHFGRMYKKRRQAIIVSPTAKCSQENETRRNTATIDRGEDGLASSTSDYPKHLSEKNGDNGDNGISTSSPSSSSEINDTASVASADEFHDLSRSMKLRCVALGIAGGTINMLCASTGVKYANAITSGAFQCAIPPLTCFMAFLFCNETLSLAKILALIFAVVGNMVMVQVWCVFTVSEACGNANSQEEASSTEYYIGCLFLLANVTAYSAYLVFQRPVVKVLPKSEFLFRTYLYGFVGMLIVVVCRIDLVWHQLTTPGIITREVLIAIGFAGLVNSTFAYYLVSVGISGVSPAAAAIYFCLQPLFVCIFSTIFLGEGISLVQGGGGVLIIAGLLMSAAPNLPGPRQCCNKGSSVEEDDGESEVSKKSDILRIGGQQISGLLRGGAAHENVVMLKPSTYESPRNNEENVELGSAVTATAIMSTSVHDDDPEQPHHLHPDGAVSYASGSLST